MTMIASALLASVVYHATFCGGAAPSPGDACYVQAAHTAPTADGISGLNTGLFSDFFAAHGLMPVGQWHWDARGQSPDGHVFGDVWDTEHVATTQFVYKAGEVKCCYVDFQYRINSVNASGTWVGQNSDGGAFVGDEILAFWVTPTIPRLDGGSSDFLYEAELLSIDNAGNIGGRTSFGDYFQLSQVDQPTEVPEPGGISIMMAALAGLWVRRRYSSTSTKSP